MNYKKLEKNVKKLEKLNDVFSTMERDVQLTSHELTNAVVDLSKNEVKPDSEDGKKFIDFTNIIRSIGHKILNLLEINITCSFAGATLFTWSLPKIEDNKVVNKTSNTNTQKM